MYDPLTKQSVVVSDELKRLQIRDGKTEATALKFKKDMPVRWNTTFYMIERFLDLKEYVYPILLQCPSAPDMLCKKDLEVLEDIALVLKPIEKVTAEMSGEEYPTSSLVIPIIRCLTITVEKLSLSTKIGEDFREKLRQQIKIRFNNIETNEIHALSTILDPRFKKIHFQSALAASTALDKINKILKKTISKTSHTSHVVAAKLDNRESNIWEFHDQLVSSKSNQHLNDMGSGLCLELRQYLNQPVISRYEDPLKHWATLKLAYPSLSNIAIHYLAIPATSVPSERLFSKSGAIKTESRSRLTGKRLQTLLFLSSFEVEEWELH